MSTFFKIFIVGAVGTVIVVLALCFWDVPDLITKNAYPSELVAPPPTIPTTPGVARRAGMMLSGSILCANFRASQTLFSLYSQAWEEQMQDRIMPDRAQALRGKAMENPNPADYGCVIIPGGSPVKIEKNGGLQVDVIMSDGVNLRGSMLPFPQMLMQPQPLREEPRSEGDAVKQDGPKQNSGKDGQTKDPSSDNDIGSPFRPATEPPAPIQR